MEKMCCKLCTIEFVIEVWCWNPITFSSFLTVCGRWFPITQSSTVWSAVHSNRKFSHWHFFTVSNKSKISPEPVTLLVCHRRSFEWCNAWYPSGVSSLWSQRTPQISIDEQQFFTLGNFDSWIKNLDCGYPDVSNKPCVISSATLNSNTNSLKQKVKLILLVVHRKCIKLCVGNSVDRNVILASEMWCLGHFLP